MRIGLTEKAERKAFNRGWEAALACVAIDDRLNRSKSEKEIAHLKKRRAVWEEKITPGSKRRAIEDARQFKAAVFRDAMENGPPVSLSEVARKHQGLLKANAAGTPSENWEKNARRLVADVLKVRGKRGRKPVLKQASK